MFGGPSIGPPQSGTYGDGRPGGLSGEDVRQLRREFRERQGEAEDLRRRLAQAGVNTRDLNDIIGQLRGFDNDRIYDDPMGLLELQAAALERVKKFEFDLRKKLVTDDNQLSLSGSDAVPAGFRQAIEEYYRALAKRGPRQP